MRIKYNVLSTLFSGIAITVVAASAHAGDPMAWAVDGNGEFQSVDLSTTATTPIGLTGQSVFGLGELGSTVYGVVGGTSSIQVFTINTSTGVTSTLASSSNATGAFSMGSTLNGLYVEGLDSNIYSINPVTGAATELGASGITLTNSWGSLSVGGSSLYVLYNDALDTEQFIGQVNTTTGAVTQLGAISTDNTMFDAMAYIDGQWYIGTGVTPELETLNISTLTATPIGVSVGPYFGYYGLVPLVTPEPAPFAMLGLGILGFALRRKSKPKNLK